MRISRRTSPHNEQRQIALGAIKAVCVLYELLHLNSTTPILPSRRAGEHKTSIRLSSRKRPFSGFHHRASPTRNKGRLLGSVEIGRRKCRERPIKKALDRP